MQKVVSRLQNQEMVSRVQTGRACLGCCDPLSIWSRANKEKKDLLVSEITRMEEEGYRVQAMAQGCQCHYECTRILALADLTTEI